LGIIPDFRPGRVRFAFCSSVQQTGGTVALGFLPVVSLAPGKLLSNDLERGSLILAPYKNFKYLRASVSLSDRDLESLAEAV
jgi:hypothetical protein